MLRLGLTGGIGSGKSTVARILVGEGAGLIDADDIARRSTAAGGPAISHIVQAFGPDFVTADGALDRDRMRAHAFANPAAKQQLEAIIHPLVQQDIERQANAAQAPCLVFDIPLLVESPRWRQQLDRVLVIDCSEETQIARVMERNGWPRTQVEAVIRQQCPRRDRLAAADWIVCNEGIDLPTLQALVRRVAQRLPL
jgi:dephospho-CoA kinase